MALHCLVLSLMPRFHGWCIWPVFVTCGYLARRGNGVLLHTRASCSFPTDYSQMFHKSNESTESVHLSSRDLFGVRMFAKQTQPWERYDKYSLRSLWRLTSYLSISQIHQTWESGSVRDDWVDLCSIVCLSDPGVNFSVDNLSDPYCHFRWSFSYVSYLTYDIGLTFGAKCHICSSCLWSNVARFLKLVLCNSTTGGKFSGVRAAGA